MEEHDSTDENWVNELPMEEFENDDEDFSYMFEET